MRNQLPRTTIVGNLTDDPQIFGENTDTPRAVFTIAVNYGWDRENKEFQYNAFFQITYFGEAGLNFANSFSKGNRVFALCSLGNHTKTAYGYDDKDEEFFEFNQTLITLNADVAGPSTEFNEVEIAEAPAKQPKKKAAKPKRPSPKDEDPEESEESAEEETEEEEAPKKSTSGAKKAPDRRAPARRAPARRAPARRG